MSEPFFHELCLDNFAQSSVFARLRTLVRAERVYNANAPLVIQFSLYVMRQFRDTVRADCPAFDVKEFSALGTNLYFRLRGSMTLFSLCFAMQQVQDADTNQREMALLTEWIETLLGQAMERCGWTAEHQVQLSGLKESIERSALIDFMQQLAACAHTLPPERIARTTIAMLELLKTSGDIGNITLEQIRSVLNANVV